RDERGAEPDRAAARHHVEEPGDPRLYPADQPTGPAQTGTGRYRTLDRETRPHPVGCRAVCAVRHRPGSSVCRTGRQGRHCRCRLRPLTHQEVAMADRPIALIAGANRGIGLGVTKEFLSHGWDVIATARAPDKATALDELAARHPGHVEIRPLDM